MPVQPGNPIYVPTAPPVTQVTTPVLMSIGARPYIIVTYLPGPPPNYIHEPVVGWVLLTTGVFRPIPLSLLDPPVDTGRWALLNEGYPEVYDVVKGAIYASIQEWFASCP